MKLIERLHNPHGGGIRIGKTVLTMANNAHGAPFVDDATCWNSEGTPELVDKVVWKATGKAVSLVMRRDRYGARVPGKAVFVGRLKETL
jgi:hypothetical protein